MDLNNSPSPIFRSDVIIPANILKWVSESKALRFRFVCRAWNKGFLMAHLDRYTMQMVKNKNKSLGETYDHLLASEGHWQRFSFEDLDLIENPEDAVWIEICLQQYKDSIKAIHFTNCQISMAQIFQLGSIPTAIKFEEFRLINCTGPYAGGVEVISSWKYMKPFHENVQNLKRLEVVDSKIQPNPLEVWMSKSTRLVELNSAMVVNPFSEERLSDIFARNSATLNNLSLANINLDEALVGMAQLKLRQLKLKNCPLPNPVRFHGFLEGQGSLKSMQFENMKFKNLSFSFAGRLTSLETIHFENCDYETAVLMPLCFVTTLKDVTFIGKTSNLAEVGGFISGLKRRCMESLILSLGAGTDYLFKTVAKNFPNLEEFECHGIGPVSMENLSHIWKLRKLVRLCLTDCEFRGSTLNPANISDLKRLEVLDLRGTNATDETIDQVVHLENLTKVRLANTLITEMSVMLIVKNFCHELEEINVTGCPLCKITQNSLDIYNKGLDCCELECDLDLEDDEQKEPLADFESESDDEEEDDEDRGSNSDSDSDSEGDDGDEDEEIRNTNIVNQILQQDDFQDQHSRAVQLLLESPEVLEATEMSAIEDALEKIGINREYFVEEPDEDDDTLK